MQKIERPLEVAETGVLMHLAEFQLAQVRDILSTIIVGPTRAVPESVYEKVVEMNNHVTEALKVIED